MNFECPHCFNGSIKIETGQQLDNRYFSCERIQCADDLNSDPLSSITKKIELWFCCHCGGYFRAYYSLVEIKALVEK